MVTDLLRIEKLNDQDVVDSRLIAEELGIKHKNLLETIAKYQVRLERKTHLTFKTETVTNSVGAMNETRYCYLNEAQATLLMTFSRNTEKVLDCKERLTNAFMEAKRIIKEVIPQQNDEIRKLELQLAISNSQNTGLRLQKNLIDKSDAIITIHGLPVYALMIGRPDAVVEIETKVTETIVCKGNSNVSFTGSSTAEVGRKYGFTTGTKFAEWLKSMNAEHLICQGMRAVQAAYIPSENLEEIKNLWMQNRHRQILLGE
jgi:phage regulator Rha-like protein